MSNYKEILLFTDDILCGDIKDLVSLAGVRLRTSADSTDFSLKLSNMPDAVIISPETADDFTLSAISSSCSEILVAVIIDPMNYTNMSRMLENGINIFLSRDNLNKDLCRFVEQILRDERKNSVIVKALKRIRNLASNAKEGIIILDDDYRIDYSNKAAEELLGMEKKELRQSVLDEILISSPYQLSELADKPIYIDNFEIETIKGRKLFINSTCSANIERGLFAGAVIIFSEVSTYYIDKQKELELLKYQQRYHSTQQNLAFKKQMIIMKDEVSNIVAGDFNIETYFKPLDVLSGDLYGSINIKDGRYLFYIIDAMGKGLSASVTALQSSSFINHSLELSMLKLDFDLNRTITSFMHYIRDRLMEEEALCVVFALLDTNNNSLTIANYGMPPVQLVDKESNIRTIKPNNLPIMRCLADKNIDTIDLGDIDKIMIMSDGLIETETKDGNLYMDYLKEDLVSAHTKKHMLSKMSKRMNSNEDDITFFFIKKAKLNLNYDKEFIIQSDLHEITSVSAEICENMVSDGITQGDISMLEYALSEILMNALEHGNLELGYDEKQTLIAQGIYDEFLMKNTQEGSPARKKTISIRYKYEPKQGDEPGLVMISVKDDGKGFSPANLLKYHSFDGNLCHIDKTSYNGRGIFITDNLIDGLYYSDKGNCAYMIKLIEN